MSMETKEKIIKTFDRLAVSFRKVLYEEDTTFMENMRKKGFPEEEIKKYQFWEWTQGVGLYGFWRYFEFTGNSQYLDLLVSYYDRQLEIGLPAKNVNTVAPLLPLSFLAEYTHNDAYMNVCKEWASWIMESFPRTKEGGFQHITSDSINEGELWDDTLFMTVLFLANMGRILGNAKYTDEALYQFLIHAKYLADRKTGLWYHGWTFGQMNNFAGAFWGRGNSWITAAIPEFLSIVNCGEADRRYLQGLLETQVETLSHLQAEDGMWHTLLDDASSYKEASATCGIGYGILRGISMGLLEPEYSRCAEKALESVLDCIDQDGVVNQVSYGTPMGRETKDFYKQIPIRSMPYGQALAMLFLLEMLKLEK
ncbi:MAG: glycoside hydrolase family 88 protein [Treponemataceae bacterium]|nr:glycoside hydrolase family 88 protein [Treponemataceae bacterium]